MQYECHNVSLISIRADAPSYPTEKIEEKMQSVALGRIHQAKTRPLGAT
jgi:hypothetical protein